MTTLNDMTPEALRDLVLRANATADGKEMAQQQIEKLRKEREADKEAKRKAEKDIIPPAGTFWRYNKRVWTVIGNGGGGLSDVLVSADAATGGDLRGWWIPANKTRKFSDDPYPKHFGWKMYDKLLWRSAVGELVLRRASII